MELEGHPRAKGSRTGCLKPIRQVKPNPGGVGRTVTNAGTCRPDAKGEIQVGGPYEDESTDAGHRDGAARSSGEGPVMGLERRGCVVQLWREANRRREEPHG